MHLDCQPPLSEYHRKEGKPIFDNLYLLFFFLASPIDGHFRNIFSLEQSQWFGPFSVLLDMLNSLEGIKERWYPEDWVSPRHIRPRGEPFREKLIRNGMYVIGSSNHLGNVWPVGKSLHIDWLDLARDNYTQRHFGSERYWAGGVRAALWSGCQREGVGALDYGICSRGLSHFLAGGVARLAAFQCYHC